MKRFLCLFLLCCVAIGMIACGNNTVLEVLEIQQTGKNKISAKDFANGALRKYL